MDITQIIQLISFLLWIWFLINIAKYDFLTHYLNIFKLNVACLLFTPYLWIYSPILWIINLLISWISLIFLYLEYKWIIKESEWVITILGKRIWISDLYLIFLFIIPFLISLINNVFIFPIIWAIFYALSLISIEYLVKKSIDNYDIFFSHYTKEQINEIYKDKSIKEIKGEDLYMFIFKYWKLKYFFYKWKYEHNDKLINRFKKIKKDDVFIENTKAIPLFPVYILPIIISLWSLYFL